MKTLQIELPPEVSEEEARLLLAIKLYELGRLSLGQSAKLAGYSKQAFIELLGKYGVPVVAYLSEELPEEVEGLGSLVLLTAHALLAWNGSGGLTYSNRFSNPSSSHPKFTKNLV
jgi:predicted HTH domain antitoxin